MERDGVGGLNWRGEKRKAGRQISRLAGRQVGRQVGRQAGRKAGRQVGRQAGRLAAGRRRLLNLTRRERRLHRGS